MSEPPQIPLGEAASRPAPVSRALLGALIAAMILIWAFNFLIAKVGLRYLDPLTLASFRVVLAGCILTAVYLRGWRERPRPSRGDLLKFAELGLLGVALNQVLFTVGLNYTTVSHSSLIIGSGPITILLLARLHGLERLTWRKLVGMALCFCGVAVLALEKGVVVETHAGERTGTWLGDVITLVGSLAFAMYAVHAKKVTHRYDTLSVTAFAHVFGAMLIFPLAVRQALQLDWAAVEWPGWAALAYMAGMASVSAYLIWFWALKHLAASRLAVFGYLQPLLATLLGIAILGDPVTVYLLAGGTLVLAGVALAELRTRRIVS